MRATLLSLALLLGVAADAAAQFQRGDVVVVLARELSPFPDDVIVDSFNVYDRNGLLKQQVYRQPYTSFLNDLGSYGDKLYAVNGDGSLYQLPYGGNFTAPFATGADEMPGDFGQIRVFGRYGRAQAGLGPRQSVCQPGNIQGVQDVGHVSTTLRVDATSTTIRDRSGNYPPTN